MEKAIDKAKILMEALPYIKKYSGKKVVIKFGGAAMEDEKLIESVTADVALMKYVGLAPVIVHGGSLEINRLMEKLGKEIKFVDGLRVTDAETRDIVRMVLVGKINKDIVAKLNKHGRIAVGISGEDAELIKVTKKRGPKGVDLGFVGDIKKIDHLLVDDLIADGFVPVIATIGVGDDHQAYNINADTVAAAMAGAIKAEKIIYLTNVAGLYGDFKDKKSLISEITKVECQKLIKSKKLDAGMLPKVESCIHALEAGVKRAHMLDGRTPHALLLEIFTDKGIGTMIR